MILDFSKLEQETFHLEHSFAPGEVDFDYKGYSLAEPVELLVDATKNSRDEVGLHGRVTGKVRVSCDRCDTVFDYPVDTPFDLYFIPASREMDEKEKELDADELDECYYTDPRLDLGEVVNEQLILSLPIKVLCREDCLGLCPRCGGNLNVQACSCDTRDDDPRMLLLREIQKRMKHKD